MSKKKKKTTTLGRITPVWDGMEDAERILYRTRSKLGQRQCRGRHESLL